MVNKMECSINDCLLKVYAKGFCRKHYDQYIHGRGMFRNFSDGRRRFDPNEFSIEGEICTISLYNNQNIKMAETIIDAEDYERCKSYRWYSDGHNYVTSEFGYLSNFIMNFKSTRYMVVDHINGDSLDNRKENLQIVTNQQNQCKKRGQKNNTSGYRGVFKASYDGKWASEIVCNGKKYRFGPFCSKEIAASAYNEAAKKLFGRFAVLNSINQKETSEQTVQRESRLFNG